jgi:Zn-finger nucleic acid-binding protein
MIVAEYRGIEIDSCAACGGIWLDGGELEAMVGSGVPAMKQGDPALGPPEVDCPICVDKLLRARHGPTGVVVDRCPHGDGTWFDAGELEQMLAAHRQADAADHDGQAAQALADFFEGRPPRKGPPTE